MKAIDGGVGRRRRDRRRRAQRVAVPPNAQVGGDHGRDHQAVAEGDGDCAAGRVVWSAAMHASLPRGQISGGRNVRAPTNLRNRLRVKDPAAPALRILPGISFLPLRLQLAF
jgi:hypothetical protein